MLTVEQVNKPRSSFRAYVVGIYLFSVPAFAYSQSMGLLIIPQITGALLLGYAILDILGNQRIKIPREIRVYGFLGLWAVVTFYFAVSTGETETLRLGSLIKVVIATLACAQLIRDENDLFIALRIFVFSIVLVYFLNKDDLQLLRMADQITDSDRFGGTFTSPNFAAMFSLTVIWASVVLMLQPTKKILSQALYLIPIGISLLIIYYSGSKKGLFGVGLFVLFLARLLYIRQRSSFYRRSFILLVSSFLITIAGYFIYKSPFFFRIEQLFYGESVSDIRRFDLLGEATHVWLMNLKTFFMGVGYDNFRLFGSLQTNAHNTLLELLACNGIIGFFLFISFLFLLIRKYILIYRTVSDQELKSTLFSILIFLFIYSFFMLSDVLSDSREMLPVLGCLGAFGQYHLLRISRINEVAASIR